MIPEKRKPLSGWVPKRELWFPNPPLPHMPAIYDDADVAAAKALAEGRAEPHQQILIMDWFLYQACRLRDSTYLPGDPVASTIMQGMQLPAREFVKLVNLTSRNKTDSEQG